MNKILSNTITKRMINESIDKSCFFISSTANSNREVTKLIQTYFYHLCNGIGFQPQKQVLISNPRFSNTSNKITIELFYYIPNNKTKRIKNNQNQNLTKQFSKDSITILSRNIAQLYGKEVSLMFVRVYYPYMNSSIFSQYLFHNSSANTFVHFQNAILKYPSWHGKELPSYITGIKVEVAGRLTTERIIPRITKKSMVFGSISGADYLDYASYTGKNYLGSFTIKVWISQHLNK